MVENDRLMLGSSYMNLIVVSLYMNLIVVLHLTTVKDNF